MLKGIDQTEIQKWLHGDDAGFRHIFDAYYPKLSLVALNLLKNKEDGEEMVMDVFYKVWKKRYALEHVENFETYLIQSLRNHIVDRKRKKVLLMQELEAIPLETLGSTEQTEGEFKELLEIYEQALSKLTGKQREIYLMSRELGMSQKQIAASLAISQHTVNNHISTSSKILKNEMGEYYKALSILCIFLPYLK